MSKSDLTIVTVAANEIGFLDLMVESVVKVTHPTPNFVIVDNGKNGKYLEKYKSIENFNVVKNNRAHKYYENKKIYGTSIRHGLGLKIGMSYANTNRIAIIEPDCVVLNNDWDKISNGKYMKACVKGIGVNEQHYYYPCFLIFYRNKLQNIDFMPNMRGEKNVIGIKLSEHPNSKRYSDVGWRICELIKHDRVDEVFCIRCSDSRSGVFHKPFSHKTNVFIDSGDNIIAGHFWRGSDIARRKNGALTVSQQKKLWFDIVREYIGIK